MLALVSSTIYPSSIPLRDGGSRSYFCAETRLEQTRATIESLRSLGLQEIYVADNSGPAWNPCAERALAPAKVSVYEQYRYENKGISEIFLLLRAVRELPPGVPIVKISGRYRLTRLAPVDLQANQIAGRIYRSRRYLSSLSTRCYFAQNKDVLEAFLRDMLHEVFAYGGRIVGPRSMLRIIRRSLAPHKADYRYEDPPLAIESAAALAIAHRRYRFQALPELGLIGQEAGHTGGAVDE